MKYMFKNKDLTIFVRYGGLDLKNHKKGKRSNTFHSPPANRGIYAMPLCAIEYFLIGSIINYQSEIFPNKPKYPEDKEINDELPLDIQLEWDKICDEFDWDNYDKRVNKIKKSIRKTFKKDKGYIWHHLEEYLSKKAIIVDKSKEWVKTSIKDWQKALIKSAMIRRYDKFTPQKSCNNSRLFGYGNKDMYEVFIDEKI